MEKLNVAELLKDCPKGMELDCTLFEDVHFDCIDDDYDTIKCYIQDLKHETSVSFDRYGCYSSLSKAKCVIYPKGKTTWEGFQRPFKDGDVASTLYGKWIGIVKESIDNACKTYIAIHDGGIIYHNNTFHFERFATEEEKQKLFDAIKANGYKWNVETKTLEKLIEPKFKVGDRVLWNYNTEIPRTISKVEFTSERGYVYWIYCEGCSSGWWNETELTPIPNKFDITTLKPFESKVLVRSSYGDIWRPAIYGVIDSKKRYHYVVGGNYWTQCIPFEPNKELLGTTDDCDEYYKTWE